MPNAVVPIYRKAVITANGGGSQALGGTDKEHLIKLPIKAFALVGSKTNKLEITCTICYKKDCIAVRIPHVK